MFYFTTGSFKVFTSSGPLVYALNTIINTVNKQCKLLKGLQSHVLQRPSEIFSSKE